MPGEDELMAAASEAASEIGLTVRDLTAEIASRFGYDIDEGVIVATVEQGSAAEQARIQPGFLILSVNRRPVSNTKEFNEALTEAGKQGRVLLRIKNKRYSWFVLLRLG